LVYGDRVEAIEEANGGWLRVRLPGGATGWVHETAVTDEKLLPLPQAGGVPRGSVSQDEVALAGKGFNPQVEAKYREQNPSREELFRLVDAMERRDVPEAEMEAFLFEGRLGEHGGRP